MIIIAIAWMYVVILMALTQPSFLAGFATVIGYGLLPLSIVLYLVGTPGRRRRARARERLEAADKKAADSEAADSAKPDKAAHTPTDPVTPE